MYADDGLSRKRKRMNHSWKALSMLCFKSPLWPSHVVQSLFFRQPGLELCVKGLGNHRHGHQNSVSNSSNTTFKYRYLLFVRLDRIHYAISHKDMNATDKTQTAAWQIGNMPHLYPPQSLLIQETLAQLCLFNPEMKMINVPKHYLMTVGSSRITTYYSTPHSCAFLLTDSANQSLKTSS